MGPFPLTIRRTTKQGLRWWYTVTRSEGQRERKMDMNEVGEEEEAVVMEEDGPPPGYSDPTGGRRDLGNREGDRREEKEDDGPPPGYSISTSPPQPQPIGIKELGYKQEGGEEDQEDEKEEDGPPPGYSISISHHQPSRRIKTGKQEGGEEEVKEEEEEHCPPPGYSNSPPQPPTEMAQMVCGSCRRLLAYPPGARYVQCLCCQRLNVVLEAHQVGQVKCGSCALLLMYPYGSLKVRCSSCRFVTEIGVHNRRPPLSVQQAQATASPHSVH